jgi:hypothetical protein
LLAEVELGQVAVKVRLADVVLRPVDAALQGCEKALGAIDVGLAAGIDAEFARLGTGSTS